MTLCNWIWGIKKQELQNYWRRHEALGQTFGRVRSHTSGYVPSPWAEIHLGFCNSSVISLCALALREGLLFGAEAVGSKSDLISHTPFRKAGSPIPTAAGWEHSWASRIPSRFHSQGDLLVLVENFIHGHFFSSAILSFLKQLAFYWVFIRKSKEINAEKCNKVQFSCWWRKGTFLKPVVLRQQCLFSEPYSIWRMLALCWGWLISK